VTRKEREVEKREKEVEEREGAAIAREKTARELERANGTATEGLKEEQEQLAKDKSELKDITEERKKLRMDRREWYVGNVVGRAINYFLWIAIMVIALALTGGKPSPKDKDWRCQSFTGQTMWAIVTYLVGSLGSWVTYTLAYEFATWGEGEDEDEWRWPRHVKHLE